MNQMSALRGILRKLFFKSGNSSDTQKATEVYWTLMFPPSNLIFKITDICEAFCVPLPGMHLSPRWILKAMFIIPRNALVLLLYMYESPENISSPDNISSSLCFKTLYKWHLSLSSFCLFYSTQWLTSDMRFAIFERQLWFVYFPCGIKLTMLLARHKKQWREKKLFPDDPLGPICVFWKGSIA